MRGASRIDEEAAIKAAILPFLPVVLAAPAPPPASAVIVLVGDSTVTDQAGWGGSFCRTHVPPPARCINYAVGGRSSKSYRAEGWWGRVWGVTYASRPTKPYVLIQFGANDRPGKGPERTTHPNTDFAANLRQDVVETRARGGIPVLVTPLVQRRFVNGRIVDDLEPYAAAVRIVAAETGTPLVDLHALSATALERAGPAFAATLPPSDAPRDNTHLGPAGAAYFARMVAAALVRAVPALHDAVRIG